MKNQPRPNQYQATATLYDYDDRPIVKDDIPFYLEYAQKINDNILEIACGTGRITLPLAQTGHAITGLDLSPEMLAVFQNKLKQEPEAVRQNVELVQGDMTQFDLGKQFGFVFIPFRSFQGLTSTEDQLKSLECAHRHLKPDGLFSLNTFKPNFVFSKDWINLEEHLDFKVETADQTIWRTHIRRDIDLDNQIIYPDLIYYTEDKNGNRQRIVEQLHMKYFYEEQLRELLLQANFEIVEAFGYYDKKPIAEGKELIYILKKKNPS